MTILYVALPAATSASVVDPRYTSKIICVSRGAVAYHKELDPPSNGFFYVLSKRTFDHLVGIVFLSTLMNT